MLIVTSPLWKRSSSNGTNAWTSVLVALFGLPLVVPGAMPTMFEIVPTLQLFSTARAFFVTPPFPPAHFFLIAVFCPLSSIVLVLAMSNPRKWRFSYRRHPQAPVRHCRAGRLRRQ